MQVLDNPCLAPRRPFALQPDGDLWQTFSQLVIDKGPNSIAISWHKAHAKLQDMLSGKVGLEASMHNSIADWMADRGHEAQGMADLREFLEFHAAKRKKFLQLLIDINMLILRVRAEHQILREEKIF